MSASSSSSSSDSVPVAENSPPETQEDAASGEQRDYFERVSLEKIDENLFRASSDLLWTPPGARGVYGGQVLGQTLFAAANTVKQVDKRLHSLHAYFLRAGNADIPIIYYVSILGRKEFLHATRHGQAGGNYLLEHRFRGLSHQGCLTST